MNAITERPEPATASTRTTMTPPLRLARLLVRSVLAIVVLLLAVGVGRWWLQEGRWIESTDNAYVQGDIALLSPRIDGDVVAINVADNQTVHAGDKLITLDPTDWQLRLDQARSAAQEAEAEVATAQRRVDQAAAVIGQADAAIAQAQAEATRATADAARFATLVASGGVSRQTDDQAVAEKRKALAALAAAQAQRQAAVDALAVARAQVAQEQVRSAGEAIAVRRAERDLGYTVIRSPMDGVVGNRSAELGEHVKPGMQLIAVTPLPRDLYVVANFKETQLRHMRPGQNVLLTPDIASDLAVLARVESLAPATGALYSLLPPENATGNFTKVVQRVPVRIALDPATAARAGWLRAGLSVTAEVDTRGPGAVRQGLLASLAALIGL